MENNIFVFDFDSTFVKIELLEELAKIALKNNPQKNEIIKEIEFITNLGMDGKISFKESLEKRVKLFSIKANDIKEIINRLENEVSDSIKTSKDFLRKNSDNIYIISGGFKECIVPIVKEFGIKQKNVFANDFLKNSSGDVIGIDENNLILKENGKVEVLKSLNLIGTINMIGDGMTDFEVKKMGVAHNFFKFAENIKRASLIELIKEMSKKGENCFIVNNFSEILIKLGI